MAPIRECLASYRVVIKVCLADMAFGPRKWDTVLSFVLSEVSWDDASARASAAALLRAGCGMVFFWAFSADWASVFSGEVTVSSFVMSTLSGNGRPAKASTVGALIFIDVGVVLGVGCSG